MSFISASFTRIFPLALTTLIACSSQVYGQVVDTRKIDIKAIQSIQYYQKDNAFRAKVTVIFSNASESDVKLDNGDFMVGVSTKNKKAVHLGRGEVNDLIIPSKAQKTYTLDLFVGYDGQDSISRMMQIFNIIGDPKQKPIMELKGECGFGAKERRGWTTSNSVSIDWQFTPRIQDEVLFQ